jgi:RNA polymerase sigma-32 factor
VEDAPDPETRLADSEQLGQRRRRPGNAMAPLTDRERHILTERRLKEEPSTLEELSQEYGISRERVRQIEVRAFEKLQRAMRNAAIEERLVEA